MASTNAYIGGSTASINKSIKDEMEVKGITIGELADELNMDVCDLLQWLKVRLPNEVKEAIYSGINKIFISKRNNTLLDKEKQDVLNEIDAQLDRLKLLSAEVNRSELEDNYDRLLVENIKLKNEIHDLRKTVENLKTIKVNVYVNGEERW